MGYNFLMRFSYNRISHKISTTFKEFSINWNCSLNAFDSSRMNNNDWGHNWKTIIQVVPSSFNWTILSNNTNTKNWQLSLKLKYWALPFSARMLAPQERVVSVNVVILVRLRRTIRRTLDNDVIVNNVFNDVLY